MLTALAHLYTANCHLAQGFLISPSEAGEAHLLYMDAALSAKTDAAALTMEEVEAEHLRIMSA